MYMCVCVCVCVCYIFRLPACTSKRTLLCASAGARLSRWYFLHGGFVVYARRANYFHRVGHIAVFVVVDAVVLFCFWTWSGELGLVCRRALPYR